MKVHILTRKVQPRVRNTFIALTRRLRDEGHARLRPPNRPITSDNLGAHQRSPRRGKEAVRAVNSRKRLRKYSFGWFYLSHDGRACRRGSRPEVCLPCIRTSARRSYGYDRPASHYVHPHFFYISFLLAHPVVREYRRASTQHRMR